MNLIIWLIVGGILGWLASIVMRTDAQQGIMLNIVVGVIGAFLAGLVFAGGTINQSDFSLSSLIASFLGAVVLLAVVNLIRRGCVRLRLSAPENIVDDQYRRRSQSGGDPARPFPRIINARDTADKSGEQRPGDTQQHRDCTSARIIPGHDQLGKNPGHQAQRDPDQNIHVRSLPDWCWIYFIVSHMKRSTSPSGRLTQFRAGRTIFVSDAIFDAHFAGSASQDIFRRQFSHMAC